MEKRGSNNMLPRGNSKMCVTDITKNLKPFCVSVQGIEPLCNGINCGHTKTPFKK